MDQRSTTSCRITVRRLLRERTASPPTFLSILTLLWSKADGLAKRFIVFTLLLLFASSVIAALAPLLLKVLIDNLGPNRSHIGSLFPLYLISGYALSHWLSKSSGELRGMFYGLADQRIRRTLSEKLFSHVMALPFRFHISRKTGALSQTLTNGLLGYLVVLNHVTLTILPVAVEVVTMCLVLLLLDHSEFFLILCISVLLYTIVFWFGVMRIRSPARAASNASIEAHAVLTDSILNYETVKYFNAETQVRGRFDKALLRTEDHWKKLYRQKAQNGLLVAAIFALSLGFCAFVAAQEVQQNTMSIGEFVLVNAYILQIIQPLEMMGFAFRDIAQGTAFIEKMSAVLCEEPEVDIINRASPLPQGPPELVFESVSYSYLTNRDVLKDISLVVPQGKTVGVVGVSGSGKSSLVRLLVRLVEPNEGRIWLNGVPLDDIPISLVRNTVAVVPQDITLFNDSIAYNIGFGRQGSTSAEIVTAAKVAHIHDFITKLPEGYRTTVGERGLKLSGGEKQRIAIARAAIKRPSIFAFDEATSSLDSKTEREILRNLMEITKTTTTLIIAHRLSTVAHADQIIVLDQGCIVERGTHLELLHQRGVYSAMWRRQCYEERALQDNISIA